MITQKSLADDIRERWEALEVQAKNLEERRTALDAEELELKRGRLELQGIAKRLGIVPRKSFTRKHSSEQMLSLFREILGERALTIPKILEKANAKGETINYETVQNYLMRFKRKGIMHNETGWWSLKPVNSESVVIREGERDAVSTL